MKASSSWINSLATIVVLSLVDWRCAAAFTTTTTTISVSSSSHKNKQECKNQYFHPTTSRSFSRQRRVGWNRVNDASVLVQRVATPSSSPSTESLTTPTEALLPLPPGRSTRNKLARFFHDDTLRLLRSKTMARYQLTRKRTFGPIFKTNIFFTPTVFVVDDDTIQELGSQEFQHKRSFQAFFPPHHTRLFGPGSILVTSGATHDRIRQLVATSLSPTVVTTAYQTIVQDSVHEFVRNLAASDETTTTAEGSYYYYTDMVPRVRSFFVQLMLQVVLGSSEGIVPSQLAKDIDIWSRGLLAPPLTAIPWSRASKALRARKRISQQFHTIIQNGNYRPNGLLAKLLEARIVAVEASAPDKADNSVSASSEWRLSIDEVIDNVLTLLFAGSDTTASVTMSVWKVLVEHPIVQHDLRRNNATDERIDAFVRLVMQAHPPAPFSMRLLTDEVSVSGYRIPAHWLVVYGLAGALLSRTEPNAWMGPNDSNSSFAGPTAAPSSSSTSTSTSTSRSTVASWLPFGTGPRQCPGRFLATLELRCMTQSLAQIDWELEPGQNLAQRYMPGLFPVDGFKVKIAKKKSPQNP